MIVRQDDFAKLAALGCTEKRIDISGFDGGVGEQREYRRVMVDRHGHILPITGPNYIVDVDDDIFARFAPFSAGQTVGHLQDGIWGKVVHIYQAGDGWDMTIDVKKEYDYETVTNMACEGFEVMDGEEFEDKLENTMTDGLIRVSSDLVVTDEHIVFHGHYCKIGRGKVDGHKVVISQLAENGTYYNAAIYAKRDANLPPYIQPTYNDGTPRFF